MTPSRHMFKRASLADVQKGIFGCGYGRRELWCTYVGTAIGKSIVVSFLPCLIAFLGFHPYMLLHFLVWLIKAYDYM